MIDRKIIEEAAKYGLKGSTYNLLPPHLRESALQKDIQKAKERTKLKGGVADAGQ